MTIREVGKLVAITIILTIITVSLTIALSEPTEHNQYRVKPFVNSKLQNIKNLQVIEMKEAQGNSDSSSADHKFKLSILSSGNKNRDIPKAEYLYLLRQNELKSFLRTLPVEILRKLKSVAVNNIESAQKLVIKLARERKKKAIELEYLEQANSEAKPLVALNNLPSESEVTFKREIISTPTPAKHQTMSGFLSNFKFQTKEPPNVAQSDSPWMPILSTPQPATSENTTTLTYVIHEIVHPQYYSENSEFENSFSPTTRKYPSLETPQKNPLPTTAMPSFPLKSDNNYRPTIFHSPNGLATTTRSLYPSTASSVQFPDSFQSSSSRNPGIRTNKYSAMASMAPQYGKVLPYTANNLQQNSWMLPPIQTTNGAMYYTSNEYPNYYSEHGGDTANPTPHQLVWTANVMQGLTTNNVNGNDLGNWEIDNGLQVYPSHSQQQQPMYPQQAYYNTVQQANPYINPNYQLHPSPSSYYTVKPSVLRFQNTYPNKAYVNQDPGHSSSHPYAQSYYPPVYDNNNNKGVWTKAKAYFSNGKGVALAAKAFEISLGVLAFLAFGGYVTMLLYQAFAITATVPLFPLITQAIPPDRPLLGVLFGRSLYFNSYPGVSRVQNAYLDKLERQVNTAFKNIRNVSV